MHKNLPWWPEFTEWLQDAVPRADWPDSEIFWVELHEQIAGLGPAMAAHEICKEATRRLIGAGFPFPSDLAAKLRASVKAVYKDVLSAQLGQSLRTRAEATRASLGCLDCGGMGLTYRIQHGGETPGRAVSFYCTCPAGRWIERAHREGDEPCRELREQTLDLADFPELQLHRVEWSSELDNRCRYHPRDWDEVLGRPKPRIPIPEDAPIPRRKPREKRFENPVPNIFQLPSVGRSIDGGDF